MAQYSLVYAANHMLCLTCYNKATIQYLNNAWYFDLMSMLGPAMHTALAPHL